MEWIDRMDCALDYIEEHLDGPILYDRIAHAACCSAYHFPRMFASLAGISLSEYIRRRRLSRAAFDLQECGMGVIDVAVKYGYASADAFARAFSRQHGILPSKARDGGVRLMLYPRIAFQMTLKGDAPMQYRIEDLGFSSRIVGRRFSVDNARAFEIVPQIWKQEMEGTFIPRLIDMAWEKPQCKLESLLGICGTKPRIQVDTFDYFIGVRYAGVIPEGMETIILPPCKWAVFPNVLDAWKKLYTQWLPSSGYELADLPIIECYYPPEHEPCDEMWVPVLPTESR